MTTLQLRDYQSEAIAGAAKAIAGGSKSALIVAPTASGKSLVIGGIAARAAANGRVLVLCSTQEILKQNEAKLNALAPSISTGIYCAGAGRKDTDAQVVFASRDSLGRNPDVCGKFRGIIFDEAHQVAVDVEDAKSDTMYARILRVQSPKWVVGLTGTPWRLNGGRIWGKGKLFEQVAYNIPMRLLIERGYLSSYVFPPTCTKIDTSDVAIRQGDYVVSELEKVAGGRAITEAAVTEWERMASGRRCSLFFAVSRAHGKLVAEVLCERIGTENVLYVDGESKDRETIGREIRAGKYRAVVNIGTLTTGFDAPVIDCCVFLRPTQSTSLFVQMAGRALRTSNEKNNALFLDFAGNFDRFKSIETPYVADDDARASAAPQPDEIFAEGGKGKECPECGFRGLSSRATFCPYCGEVFVKALNKPFTGELVRKWMEITKWTVDDYLSKQGNWCKRITYVMPGFRVYREYFSASSPYAIRKYHDRMSELDRNPYAVYGAVDGMLIKPERFAYDNVS